MIEARFPDSVSRGATGGDSFLTQVSTLPNGNEQRVARRSTALGRWTISFANRDKTLFQSLRNWFLAVKGQFSSFRYKDWEDFESDIQQSCSPALGTGAVVAFQLIKTYTVSAPLTSYVRTITKPVSGTVSVYDNGVLVNPVNYAVSTTTGIVTFGVAPIAGHTIKATYEFDKVVRLDRDERESSIEHSNLYTWDQISLVEVPEL